MQITIFHEPSTFTISRDQLIDYLLTAYESGELATTNEEMLIAYLNDNNDILQEFSNDYAGYIEAQKAELTK